MPDNNIVRADGVGSHVVEVAVLETPAALVRLITQEVAQVVSNRLR